MEWQPLKHARYRTVWKAANPAVFVCILAKWTAWTVGFEIVWHGVAVFVGPFSIAIVFAPLCGAPPDQHGG